MADLLQQLQEKIGPTVRANEPMAKHTTYKLGGPAEYFVEATTSTLAGKALKAAHELGLPYFVFGGGSNMVVSDAGIKGLVIKMTNRNFDIEGSMVSAEAGAPTGLVSLRTTEAGLTGFEWAVGLPGTIGGATRGNGGMFGGEMKDSIVNVRVFHDGEEKTLTNAECEFVYRGSLFKRDPSYVVLETTMEFKPSEDIEAGKAKLREYLFEKKAKQPIEYACAGCIFTNWHPEKPEDVKKLGELLGLSGDEKVPTTPMGNVPAGWIIDHVGLKGEQVGGLIISPKHANFFVNDGTGTTDHLMQLIALAKTRIRNATHGLVQLKEEVEFVGF